MLLALDVGNTQTVVGMRRCRRRESATSAAVRVNWLQSVVTGSVNGGVGFGGPSGVPRSVMASETSDRSASVSKANRRTKWRDPVLLWGVGDSHAPLWALVYLVEVSFKAPSPRSIQLSSV